MSDFYVESLICDELLDEFYSFSDLLHLHLIRLYSHLPSHEVAGELAQVLVLAASTLVGEDQLVGAIGDFEVHIRN
jgi:hypothetical protein